ncbi:MAG TPA: SurA N-terminal domain-containing protein, partial [Chlamydiales bacterium]|nr:SurA N-terminal domain-containing protein [Chlamydiales bacterium]
QSLISPLLPTDLPKTSAAPSNGPRIAVQNSVLLQVNDTTISMIDVKKQMDLLFHQYYANLEDSTPARHQFYETSWRKVLMDLIDNELILADATDKELKLSDGEVREEMEMRFGPNVLSTLDRIGVTYEEAWKMLRKEMLVQRMSWWFVHSRAIQSVTPSEIRQSYRLYLEENPPYQELTYRILSIRAENLEQAADQIHTFLDGKNESPDSLMSELLAIDSSIQLSSPYTTSDLQLADAQKELLTALLPQHYSAPLIQQGRDKKRVAKIFYLLEKEDHPAPSFEELSASLRSQLIQKATMRESQNYVAKLRKRYGFDASFLKESFPEDLHPFSLQ